MQLPRYDVSCIRKAVIHGTTLNVVGGFNEAGLIFSTDEMLNYESGPADSWSKTS